MTLDASYTEYPKRRHGYDHELYTWSAMHERKPVDWGAGRKVAIWLCVSLEWFPITPSDTPFRAPGHMQTAYPDYRHYTAREYGTRIGVYRLLDAFTKAGVTASFATNSANAERYPELVADIIAGGHEIIAHSTDMNGTIASGMAEGAEAALISTSLDALEKATGARPQGWASIARSQSWHTPDLLVEAGVKYCCDWVNDELPYRFNNGLINLPLNHELSDRQIITVQQKSADSYAESMRDAYDWLAKEAAQFGGRMLPMHITPYIIGLPYRIDAFEKLLGDLRARDDAWFATGGEIVDAWEKQL
jgi:peptidoglycan/xylan/chitin deacetylase (PgdA/CDA1 family)